MDILDTADRVVARARARLWDPGESRSMVVRAPILACVQPRTSLTLPVKCQGCTGSGSPPELTDCEDLFPRSRVEYLQRDVTRHECWQAGPRAVLRDGSYQERDDCDDRMPARIARAVCSGAGQRWFEAGLSPCLSLRALHLSERLRPCFAKLQAARFATLAAA